MGSVLAVLSTCMMPGDAKGPERTTINRKRVDISHFDLQKSIVLGAGGFSIVRAACMHSAYMHNDVQRDSVGRVYAIKIISKRRVMTKVHGRQTVFRELNLLKRIMDHQPSDHPGRQRICDLKYAFAGADSLYLVMELCWGGQFIPSFLLTSFF